MILTSLVLVWCALRRKKDVLAGISLGAVCAIKLFPVFLIIPLLRGRKVRAVCWTLGVTTALSFAGVLLAGFGSSAGYISSAQPGDFHYWGGAPFNISLVGSAVRWLSPSIWQPGAMHLAHLAVILAFGLMVFAALGAWRTPARLSGDPLLSATAWMVLASPLAWDHYAVALLPLMLVVIVRSWQAGRVPPIAWMIGAAFVIVGMPPVIPIPPQGVAVLKQLLLYGLPTYGLLAMTFCEWVGPKEVRIPEDAEVPVYSV